MAEHRLTVIAGALNRERKPVARQVSGLAKRWRAGLNHLSEPGSQDRLVVPLMDGWIRRIERQAGESTPVKPT
jgi:hypothetical protein